MSDYFDDLGEHWRIQNIRRQREEEEKRRRKEPELETTLLAGVFNLIAFLVSIALVLFVFILKTIFYFFVFLRNKFFIHWNWYVKLENAIIMVFKKLMYVIFVLPFVILFKYWELWIIIGAVLLFYYYDK